MNLLMDFQALKYLGIFINKQYSLYSFMSYPLDPVFPQLYFSYVMHLLHPQPAGRTLEGLVVLALLQRNLNPVTLEQPRYSRELDAKLRGHHHQSSHHKPRVSIPTHDLAYKVRGDHVRVQHIPHHKYAKALHR